MAQQAVQMLCVALGAGGLIGVIICCALPEWLVVHYDDYTKIRIDLWKVCEEVRGLPQKCTMFDPPYPYEISAIRNFIIFSCILCGLGLLSLFFGSDFTTCVQNEDSKPKMILWAGMGLLVAGLMVIIPVSMFLNDMRNPSKTMTLGASIYIGFIAGSMLMLIGGLLCYLSRSSSSGGTASFSSTRV